MTELIALVGPWRTDKTRSVSCLSLLKNASVRNARLVLLRLTPELRPSRRPRSPSSNHNVKEPRLRANFHSSRDGNRPQDRQAIGRRGAVYRVLDFRCQTVNALNLRNFFG